MIIDNSGTGIASLGRDEDRFVAHVAPGERVIPPVISADTQARLSREMMAAGLDPNEYIVGPHMSINPITGQPEFGWLKKTFKSVKKVAKTVGPIAVNFLPVGPLAKAALTAGVGKASGLSTKEALLGGALSYGGSKLFGGTPGTATSKGGSLFTGGGADGIGRFGKVGDFFGNVKKGIGSLFGGGQPQLEMGADGNYFDPVTGDVYTYDQLSEMGMLDRSGNLINSPLANLSNDRGIGSFFGRETPQFIKSIGDAVGLGGESGLQDFYGGGGSQGQGGSGGMFGGNLGLMGLAGLAAKIAYDSAKERSGGLAETPKVTMDQLGRYEMAKNLGTGGSRADFGLAPAPVALKFNMGGPVRQYFNKGGLAMVEELDMREGGESDGPGTGTSDDIPAMLSDGEFVMTAKATRGAGAFDVNKTKSGIELIKGGSASREEGVKNMRELMNIFEAI